MAGFMAGFGTKLSELIEEDRKYYRDAAAKRRDYIQTYGTRAVMEREDKANAALGVANTLMNRGFSKEYVTSIAANNGVRSMVEFADQISKRTDLTEKDIKEIEASAKDFVKDNPDEDLSTVVKRAYGLYKSTKDPVERKRNIFGAMLGLDASMMEDDVLNDMYIDGYTGSDIYRIMGSAGPGAGKPMGVKLPPKPYTFRQNNDFLTVSMVPNLENFLVQDLNYYGQLVGDAATGAEAKKQGQAIIKQLQGVETLIKGKKYSEAMQTYLELENAKYGSSFLGSLQQLDDRMPGAVTRNPLLTEGFLATYKKEIGDIKDDEAAAEDTTGTAGTQAPIVTTDVKQPPKNATVTDTGVIKFKTVADRDAAVEAGTIPLNADVQVADGPIVPFTPPPSYEPVDTSMTDPSSLEGVADASGVSVAELVEPKPELTVEERVQAKRDAAQGVIDAVDSNVSSFTQRLDQGFASGAMTTNAYGNTILGGVAQTVGANDLADFFYTQAVKSEDGAETTEGLIPAINNLLDEFGVPDYSETDDPQVALDKAVEFVLSALPQDEKYDAALDRAPEHIEKLGSQATDAWRKLTAAVKDFSFSDISLKTPEEDNPMLAFVEALAGEQSTEVSEEEPANVATRASDAPAYKQLQELLQERIALANRPPKTRKKKEETIKKKAEKILIDLGDMSGAPGFRTEEVSLLSLILADELPERIVEYNPRAIGTVGSRDLGLRDTTDDVRPPRSRGADVQTKTRAPLGDTRTDADPTLPASMVAEQMTTRGKKARPSGLMSPPSSGTAPKLGQAEFGDLIDRVHGSSKAAEAFNNKVSSGKVTAADVTRLIKATRKLPKTSSRGRLLESLFDLRDALNKR